MSTQINITVGSGGLSDKARQLQTTARQSQLEKERKLRIEVQGAQQRVAAQAAKGQSLDGQPLYASGFKQPKLERRPAASRGGTDAFLIVSNVNAALDDSFTLQIKQFTEFVDYDGLLEFSSNEATTYMYTAKPITLTTFMQSAAYPNVTTILTEQGNVPVYVEPFYRLKPFKKPSSKIGLKLVNVQQNFNGNFGYLVYGFLSETQIYTSEWSANDGESILYVDFDWYADNNDFVTV